MGLLIFDRGDCGASWGWFDGSWVMAHGSCLMRL